jgi:hypothetical protein
MNMFHRKSKSKWQRVVGKAASVPYKNPAVKTGAAALTGVMTVTAASAAVSSLRRKNGS